MRIGVISDTHIPRRRASLPDEVHRIFGGVDLILHAGDINDWSVLRELNTIALTEAIAGNTDANAMSEVLGERRMLGLAGFKVGLTHGHLGKGKSTPERAFSLFMQADVIVFGHSHQPYNQKHRGVLLLNPGSATDRRREPYCSVAILTLEDQVRAEIIHF